MNTAVKVVTLGILAALCSLASAQSQYLMSVEETRKATDSIVAALAAGNTAGAMKELRPLSVIQGPEFDVFEAQINSQQSQLLQRFGEPKDYELLRTEELGSHLVLHQYLVLHARAPVRWMFLYYRTLKGWILNEYRIDFGTFDFFSPQSASQRQR